ncbi:MAG: BLUF domain-containing protein [Methylorubrum rhodinum]|uniref:BLUF domain-containing protein n=1 Tax=Methylorubrum rhodinum TaxID=29428 RepID=UPI003BB018C0
MTIHRLLYRSDMDLIGTEAVIGQQVTEIVRLSAERNAAHGLTGALLYTRGVFIQALEGALPALEETFERICRDLRHRRVELLEFAQADTRLFGEWAMVRISAGHALQAYMPSLATLTEQTSEAVSAPATIHLMRSMLVAESISKSQAERGVASK